jgi:hypothetical protein
MEILGHSIMPAPIGAVSHRQKQRSPFSLSGDTFDQFHLSYHTLHARCAQNLPAIRDQARAASLISYFPNPFTTDYRPAVFEGAMAGAGLDDRACSICPGVFSIAVR